MKQTLATLITLTFALSANAASTTKKKTTTETTTVAVQSAPVSNSHSSFSYLSDWEFTSSTTTGGISSEKACKDCNSQTLMSLGVGAHKNIKDQWQAGLEANFSQVSKGYTSSTTTTIQLVGLATYNLDTYLEESAFVRAGLGLFPVLKNDLSDYENKFGLLFAAGKRFRLASNISYMPEVRLVKKGDIDFGFQVLAINFAARF